VSELLRKSLVLALLVSLVAGVLLAVSGCGPSAEQIAKNSMRASDRIKTLHFVIKSEQALPRAPITNGQVAKQKYLNNSEGDINQTTGDLQVKLELVPGVPVTALQVDKKLYVQLAGNWYEMPQSFQLPTPVSQTLSISQYLKYFKTLNKLGDTRVEGEPCYHLQGVPDMKELVKLPGITDLLKDPNTGKQLRTVDELVDSKAVFDFYVRKKDYYMKRSEAKVEVRATQDLIKLGYAEAGDRVKLSQSTTLSKFNQTLNLQAPSNAKPWPAEQPTP
jgi:hypothetical protein